MSKFKYAIEIEGSGKRVELFIKITKKVFDLFGLTYEVLRLERIGENWDKRRQEYADRYIEALHTDDVETIEKISDIFIAYGKEEFNQFYDLIRDELDNLTKLKKIEEQKRNG